MSKYVSFEIEGADGDMLMAFEIKIKEDQTIEVTRKDYCSVADVTGDYVFGTKNELWRIQSD